jgi:hypothetical protein
MVLEIVKDLPAAAFAQMTPHSHAAQIPLWLTTLGFAEHLQDCDKRVLWTLHTPAPSVHVVPFITQQNEAYLQVFGLTLSALMHRLCKWALPYHAVQRTSHHDRRLLKSFHQGELNPQPFTVTLTVNQYVQE